MRGRGRQGSPPIPHVITPCNLKRNGYPAPPGLSAVPRAGRLAASDCARHHPLHGTQQRVPGTPSTSVSQGGGRLGWPSLRASTEHSIRLGPELISPECAVRDARAREPTCPPSPARPFRAPPTRSRTPENYRLLSPYRALAYR